MLQRRVAFSSSSSRKVVVVVPTGRSRLFPIRAEPNQDEKPKKPDAPNKGGSDPKLDFVLAEFKKAGMSASQARKVLNTWEKAGVKDPETLRKLLMQRTLPSVTGPLLQAMVDSVICFGGFYVAALASDNENFPSRILLMLAGNGIGIYYALQIFLGLGLAAATAYASYRYGTSSVELMGAIRKLAGPVAGLDLADKASSVVNMVKVLTALEEVSRLLQAQYGDAATNKSGSARDSLKNLSALLTLARAKQLGFDPQKYDLSEKQAANIALAFSQYDTNDNGTLDKTEVGNLCSSLGWKLDDEELKEAYNTLDQDKNGIVDFGEFVNWWCLRCPVDKKNA